MYVLKTDDGVILLRFLPDGRRLLVGIGSPQTSVRFEIWTLPDGERLRLPLPKLDIRSWWYSGHGNAIAISPDGERCYLAWDGFLSSFRTSDADAMPTPKDVKAHQVVLSPGGDRLLAANFTPSEKELFALKLKPFAVVVWHRHMPPVFRHVAGFLPDGDHFVTVSDKVRICKFATGEEVSATRYPTYNAHHACLSPDGRHLGVIGYSSMYVYDTTALGKPRRITSTRSCGDFESFAFHPDGRTLAVIHGGPTLVKIYDASTLKRTHTYRWKIGELACVTFSPDGMLAAAGSRDGRVVIWDVDT